MADTAARRPDPLVSMPDAPLWQDNQVGARGLPAPGLGRITVTSPYTGETLGSIPDSGPEQVDEIVRAALRVTRSWGELPLKERTRPLFRFRELLLEHLSDLAHSAARECGKTAAEAAAGVEKGIEVVEYALSLQNLDAGAALEVSRGVRCELRREPLGVVAGITPFNFPAMVPLWLFPIAVTLGNAFVLKPSDKTPLTAAKLAQLMHEAGYPEGVFSVLHGGPRAVEALLDHPDVQAYGFVGSSRIAQRVYARGAQQGKRVLALGGAKNTMILLPDADPQLAAQGIVASFTGCAGQRCMAGSLLVAVGSCDGLIERIIDGAAALRLGADMGAIIDAAAVSRLREAVTRGVSEGAKLRLDGRAPVPPPGYAGGSWFGATVLDHVEPSSQCATEELFGPVLSVVRVPTLQAALEIEHHSPYGNATSVFTQSGAAARQVADAADSGMIGINVGVPVPREPFSFGGSKGSRFGHGDITGQGGVELWTKLKKITSKWGSSDGSWMS
ncbi:MAG TPA: CoA-acylating methylmalonate-semialdehyde dehydrogenase [Polyangiales bacterium]|nr:CoA-acylating methylmalonate-semialdehyde dehydrogenase [Polyangiales bacterium]